MGNYLFFDTETTGLPKSWKAPVSNLDNWPRMVQLAWECYDAVGNFLHAANYIIYPEDFVIPSYVVRIHGISQSIAVEQGVEIREVLEKFLVDLDQSTYVVGHNISFDEKVLGAELLRHNYPNILTGKSSICTMLRSTKYCALPGRRGPKWPTLAELHYHLFHQHFDNAHDAAKDTQITAKCFWELRKRGVL